MFLRHLYKAVFLRLYEIVDYCINKRNIINNHKMNMTHTILDRIYINKHVF